MLVVGVNVSREKGQDQPRVESINLLSALNGPGKKPAARQIYLC